MYHSLTKAATEEHQIDTKTHSCHNFNSAPARPQARPVDGTIAAKRGQVRPTPSNSGPPRPRPAPRTAPARPKLGPWTAQLAALGGQLRPTPSKKLFFGVVFDIFVPNFCDHWLCFAIFVQNPVVTPVLARTHHPLRSIQVACAQTSE